MKTPQAHAPMPVSAFEFVSALWHRRKWLGILVFAALFAASVSVVLGLPDLYRASTLVLVEQAQISESFAKSSVSGEIEPRLQAVSQKILSRSRLQGLIDRFDLYPRLREQAPPEAVIERMRRDVRLVRQEVNQQWGRGVTVAFTLSYQAWDPQTAAEVANTLASFYVRENEQIRARQASGTTALLKQQLDDIQKQLRAEQERAERQRAEQRRQAQQRRAQRLRAQQERARMAAAARARAAPGDTLAGRFEAAKRELAEMRTRLSDKHPDVVHLAREVELLERQLETAADTPELARTGRAETAGLAPDRTAPLDVPPPYLPELDDAPFTEPGAPALSRDHVAILDLYASVLKRYEEARLAETIERQKESQFRIIDPAIPPSAPAAPPRLRLMLFGLIASLGLAVGAVLLADRLDTSFHTMAELRAFANLPILAGIPHIVSRAEVWRRWLGFSAGAVLAGGGLALIVRGSYYLGQGAEQLVWMLAQRGA